MTGRKTQKRNKLLREPSPCSVRMPNRGKALFSPRPGWWGGVTFAARRRREELWPLAFSNTRCLNARPLAWVLGARCEWPYYSRARRRWCPGKPGNGPKRVSPSGVGKMAAVRPRHLWRTPSDQAGPHNDERHRPRGHGRGRHRRGTHRLLWTRPRTRIAILQAKLESYSAPRQIGHQERSARRVAGPVILARPKRSGVAEHAHFETTLDVGVDLCGNQISDAPRHRRDVVPVAASPRWRGDSTPSTRCCLHSCVGETNSLVDFSHRR